MCQVTSIHNTQLMLIAEVELNDYFLMWGFKIHLSRIMTVLEASTCCPLGDLNEVEISNF